MTSKSHYYLGLYLLSGELYRAESMEQAAFLYGCVEPDFNPGTYIKGSLHGQKLRGHNFPNMLPCIHRLLEKLQFMEPSGVLYFYRLGKLTHYLTDAFTYPHNSAFCGSLKDHIKYEAELEPLFLHSLLQCRMPSENDCYGDPYTLFLEAHQDYLCSEMGKQRDIAFALRVVPGIVHVVFGQTSLVSAEVAKQEVLSANALQTGEKFSIPAFALHEEEIYQELLAQRRTRPEESA